MPEAILQPQSRLEIASGPFHPQVNLRDGGPILVHETRKVTKSTMHDCFVSKVISRSWTGSVPPRGSGWY